MIRSCHLDLPKRYAPKTHRDYDPLLFKERLEPIFDKMIANGVAFEINTSGLRQTPRTSMPSGLVVRWYADRGGRSITTGSDLHAAQTVGAGIPLTLDMLQLCGIENVASFRKHQATLVPVSTLQSARSSEADAATADGRADDRSSRSRSSHTSPAVVLRGVLSVRGVTARESRRPIPFGALPRIFWLERLRWQAAFTSCPRRLSPRHCACSW